MKIFNLLFFFVIFISENHAKVNNAELYDDFMYETEVLAKGACYSSDFPLSYYDRKDKLKQILEEFNTFMAQKALIEDSPYKFPGEDLLRMINFQPLVDKKTNIIIKMMDEKNKINYYWTTLNKNTVRKIAPGTLTMFGCDSKKIFDWEANVNSEFTSDVNKIYKEFTITVGEFMQVGLLLMEGIFAISGESNLTTRVKRAQRVTIHWILVTSGLTLMFIGLIIAVVNKNRLNKPHLATTHAQLGLSAIVISFVVALVGTVALNPRWVYPHVRPVVIKVAHAFGGIAMSVIFVATIINGTYKHSFPGGYIGRDIIFACYFFGMLLLLFKPIVGAISRSRVILKPSQPSS